MSRKDVKDNSQGFGKRQPRCCTDRLRNDATAEVMDLPGDMRDAMPDKVS